MVFDIYIYTCTFIIIIVFEIYIVSRIVPSRSYDHFTGTEARIPLPQCQWNNPENYGLMNHVSPPKTDNITKIKQSIANVRVFHIFTVELIGTSGLMGACTGYPAGLIHDRIGNTWAFVMALLLGSCSSLALYFCKYFPDFFRHAWPVFLVLWLLYGRYLWPQWTGFFCCDYWTAGVSDHGDMVSCVVAVVRHWSLNTVKWFLLLWLSRW